MKVSLFIGLILISITSCTVSKYSNKIKDDETAMKIAEDEAYLASIDNSQPLARGVKSRGIITISMLAKFASVGAKAVKNFIDNEKKKYTAEYTDGLSSLYFYSHISEKDAWDPEGIQFKDFTFIRTFKNKKGKLDTAVKITFMLDTSKAFEIYNNAIFKLKVKEIEINYAKAKLPTRHWYFPWTYLQKEKNDKLDMDIEIAFSTTYNSQQGVIYHNQEIGKFYLLVRDAPLNKKDSTYTSYYKDLCGETLDGYSFIVPRSFGHYYNGREYLPCYSQGNYNITIKIRESGQDKFVDKLIMDNSGVAVDVIANQVKKMK